MDVLVGVVLMLVRTAARMLFDAITVPRSGCFSLLTVPTIGGDTRLLTVCYKTKTQMKSLPTKWASLAALHTSVPIDGYPAMLRSTRDLAMVIRQ